MALFRVSLPFRVCTWKVLNRNGNKVKHDTAEYIIKPNQNKKNKINNGKTNKIPEKPCAILIGCVHMLDIISVLC